MAGHVPHVTQRSLTGTASSTAAGIYLMDCTCSNDHIARLTSAGHRGLQAGGEQAGFKSQIMWAVRGSSRENGSKPRPRISFCGRNCIANVIVKHR